MKILALALLLALRPLAAHPHAWIDLRTAPRVVAGHIVAVDFQLELDPMQSLLMLWPLNRAAAGCTLPITPSNPSETVIMAAYALDAGSTGPAQLGKEFAETGEIRCP